MPRRGMGVEIHGSVTVYSVCDGHAPQGHGSRNIYAVFVDTL